VEKFEKKAGYSQAGKFKKFLFALAEANLKTDIFLKFG